MLATVDENTYTGGTMTALADHPVAWCKDYQGGRSFYTGVGARRRLRRARTSASTSRGAIQWTAGKADPVYSDCGATVLANYQQTKISVHPNLNEPIGFDKLPGRPRPADRPRRPAAPARPRATAARRCIATLPVYTNSEDGLYGPAIDNDFATNKWVYLYYAPQTVANVKQSDGTTPTITTPTDAGADDGRRR